MTHQGQRDNNTVTFQMVEAAKAFLAARDNQSFDINTDTRGVVSTLNAEKHPRSARPLMDVMNEAAQGGEFVAGTVMRLVLDDAFEAGRDITRTKIADQPVVTIGFAVK